MGTRESHAYIRAFYRCRFEKRRTVIDVRFTVRTAEREKFARYDPIEVPVLDALIRIAAGHGRNDNKQSRANKR